ncbi:MAG TPA: PilN domain-containing protein [Tepidisphaeraceae bacterium]|nr:PilN domain-containing protein [Tepidisphaeraceae bacterium]
MSTANPLSFLPENYLADKAKRRANLICASLFFVVVVAIGSALALANRSLAKIERQHQAVQKQYNDAAKRIEQVKQLQDKQQIMSHQAELAASLLERVPRSNLLAEITNALPTGVSLVDLTMTSKVRHQAAEPEKTPMQLRKEQKQDKAKGPEPKLYDVTIKLTGVAGDDVEVAQFIRNLSSSKLLQDVNLVVVNESKMGGDPVRKFELDMMINPNADLQGEGLK